MSKRAGLLLAILILVGKAIVYGEGGIPLSVLGQVQTGIWFSPETKLVTSNYIYLSSDYYAEGTKNISVYGSFGWIFQPAQGFGGPYNGRFGPAISRTYLRINGAILPGLPKCSILFGEFPLSLSPYVVDLADDFSGYARGISVNNLSLSKLTLNGFYIWHGSNDRVGTGIKALFKQKEWQLTSVIASSLLKTERQWHSLDTTLSFEGSYKKNNYDLAYLLAENQKENKPWQYIRQLSLGFNGRWGRVELGYFDFDKNYDPIYRKRLPMYSVNGLNIFYYGGNPVDNHSDRVTKTLNVNMDLKVPVTMAYEIYHYKSRPTLQGVKLKLSTALDLNSWETKVSFSSIDSNEAENKGESVLEIKASKPINDQFTRYLLLAHGRTDLYGAENKFICGLKSSVYGLDFYGGYSKTKGAGQRIIGGTFSSHLGLKLSFQMATPNQNEEDNFWYDEDGNLHYRDNYFLLQSSIYF